MQNQMRRFHLVRTNFDIQPTYIADTTAERLCRCFLRRKTRCQRLNPSPTLLLLQFCKNPIQETLPMLLNGFGNTVDFDQINTGSQIHNSSRYGPAVATIIRSGLIYRRAARARSGCRSEALSSGNPLHGRPGGCGRGRAQARRGSKASRTTSANRLAASTSTNMNAKTAAKDHQTIGSRASSARAMLIMVPKLIVDGSTPMPT